MTEPAAGSDEDRRLSAVAEYGFGTPVAEPGFDRLVQLATNVFDVPIALVSLVEAERQLFVARAGLDVCETARDSSFCAHAIRTDAVMVVPDAAADPRFRENPLVTGKPHIRFYAGAPLTAPSGDRIGTLCLIDTRPRDGFDEANRGKLRDMAALVLDKLELQRLEVARRADRRRFESIAATSPDAIVCADADGTITFWNGGAERLLGHAAADMLATHIDRIAPGRMNRAVGRLAGAGGSLLERRSVELDVQRRDGTPVPVELTVASWEEQASRHVGVILRDISERRGTEARFSRLGQIDSLTGLPNRAVLMARIEKALKIEKAACVMLVDLDGFRDVNESLGHAAGDAVLVGVARRLQACVRPADTVARMGVDEYAILMPGMSDPAQAAAVADEAIASLSEMSAVDGQSVTFGASVGIALYPADGGTAEELLSSADLALNQAKAEGRHCRRFFAPGLRKAAVLKRAYKGELRRAFEKKEFELFYQPQFRLSDGALVGAEALLRWRHPKRGILTPGAFLPALEKSPLAAPVGDWTIMEACEQTARWLTAGAPPFRMGVNLFGAQLGSGDLAAKVQAALAVASLPPAALELEVTENIILRHNDEMMAPLHALHEQGVGIAFDDYGTGYASLSMLKRYPLTRLKIDQSFIRDMCHSPADAALVRAILYLGRSFGLEVIAEGVETEEQAARLRKKGCQEVQGYLFGRPMDAEAFGRLIAASRVDDEQRGDERAEPEDETWNPAQAASGRGPDHTTRAT